MKIEERTFPSVDQLEKELDKVQYRKRFGKVFRGTVFYLVVVDPDQTGHCDRGTVGQSG